MNSSHDLTSRNCSSMSNNETSCNNASTSLPPWYSNAFNTTLVVLYALIIIAALTGNIIVCVAVCINSSLRQNVASYFIVSLAISDIGTTCFSMTFDLEGFTTNGKWYHGEALCIIWTTAYLITVPSSIWNLFVMSIDRYKTLKNPWNKFKESHSMTARRAVITIAALWIYCLAFALLPVMGWKAYPQSVTKNNYCYFNISVNFSIVGSVFNFYLPMFAMCYIYYKVYQIAHAHIKFPLALRTRYDTESGNGSRASTLYPLESLGRPSIDQHHSHESTNQETANRDIIGLENVSFCLEEESTGRESMRDEQCQSTEKQKESNDSVDALRLNSLENADIDNEDLGNKAVYKPPTTNQCTKKQCDLDETKDGEDLHKHCYGLLNYDNTDNILQHQDTKNLRENTCKESLDEKRKAKNKTSKRRFGSDELMLSTKEISALGEGLSCEKHSSVERDECNSIKETSSGGIHSKPGKIIQSLDNDKDIEKIKTGINEKTEEKRKCSNQQYSSEKDQLNASLSFKNSFRRKRFFTSNRQDDECVKSESDVKKSSYNSLCTRKQKFPLVKTLKKKSQDMSEEDFCSLRKFRKKSIEKSDEYISRRESSTGGTCCPPGEPQGTLNRQQDSVNSSDQRRLKHFSKNKKAARTISIIVGAFLVCWVPFTTMSIFYNVCGKPCFTLIPAKVFHILLWMGYVNSAINPILFSYQNIQFRKSYRRIACALFPCLKKQ